MQYMHRRLQRSVTERRRLTRGRASASRSITDGACVRAVRIGAATSMQIPPRMTFADALSVRLADFLFLSSRRPVVVASALWIQLQHPGGEISAPGALQRSASRRQ